MTMRPDPFKLARWMNARKITPEQLARDSCVSTEIIAKMLSGSVVTAESDAIRAVAAALLVDVSQIASSAEPGQSLVIRDADELHAKCRAIERDGIKFYNYYPMAAAPGRVGPVILDILCPHDRIPALNNGHLEPAITVNLGPGEIYGRWGEFLTEDTWRVLRTNLADDRWIVGDSYVEPSYCPHAYSLASTTPARIVSYTGASNLVTLIEEANHWPEPAFRSLLGWLGEAVDGGTVLDFMLARRGYDRQSAAVIAGLHSGDIDRAISNPFEEIDTIRRLARAIGVDYRLLMPADRQHDSVGKSIMTVAGARATVRGFGTYQLASMSSAPHLPDLSGLFMKINGDDARYMTELADTHYLVVTGHPSIEWVSSPDRTMTRELDADASVWAAPMLSHRWLGHGSVLKFGSGNHVGYQDLIELTNTFDPAATLNRAYHDLQNWGYDG
jgi:transcriptional regulator with XRE-family HTH domain